MPARAALSCLAALILGGCALPGSLTQATARPAAANPQGAIAGALSARIHGSQLAQTAMVKALFSAYRQQVNAVVDDYWTPAFTASLMAKPAVRRVLASAKPSSRRRGGKVAATAADVIPAARQQIEQRRAALHEPLEALQAALLSRLDSQTRAMDAMNTVLATGGRGALPADVSQAAMPPAAVFEQLLEQTQSAIGELQDNAAHTPALVNQWPVIAEAYSKRLAALTASLGG